MRPFVTPHTALVVLTLTLTQCAPASPGVLNDGGIQVNDNGFSLIPFDLGTGLTEWQPIPLTDAHMKLIMGPQGGYHVLGRMRFSTFSSDVSLRFRVISLDGMTVYNNPNDVIRRRDRQGLLSTATGWESSSAELVIFTAIRGPLEAAGKTVRWETIIEDNATGQRAYAQRVVVVDWP